MADAKGLAPIELGTGAYEAQAGRLLQGARSGAEGSRGEAQKIEKSAHDFESILLGSWLQQAQKSFASVPGGDEDEDEDPGKDQFQSLAMQSLAGSLVTAGGIGIAGMISADLTKADKAQVASESKAEPTAGSGTR